MRSLQRLSGVHALGFMLLMLLPACAPVYVPNTLHTPLLEEQGDVRLGVHGGTSGADLQAAAAFTDHVGVIADFSLGNRQGDESDPASDDDYHRHRFGEVGLGYFTTWGRSGRVEVYGGYGRGWAESTDEYELLGSNILTATGRYNRFFIQPAVGVDAGPLRLSGGVRVVRLHFYEFESSGTTVSESVTEGFIEPAVGLGVGVRGVRMGVQVGISRPLDDPDDIVFDYQPAWMSVGLQFKFNARP